MNREEEMIGTSQKFGKVGERTKERKTGRGLTDQ